MTTRHLEALDHLRGTSEVMAKLIDDYELRHITPKPPGEYFDVLVGTIISQQLSVKAADTIESRFRDAVGGFSPETLANLSVEDMRQHGLSQSKATYIQGLAHAFLDGRLDPLELEGMSDAEITQSLTALKGIGPWTVEMFLMFGMGHPDVWSPGDLGLRNALSALFGEDSDPLELTNTWRPYRTYAALYLWEYSDGTPAASRT